MTEQTESVEPRKELASKIAVRNRPNSVAVKRGAFFSKHQTIINFWLDAVLLISFSGLVWISVIVRFVFPPAEAAAGYTLWGRSLSKFMDLQFGVLAFFFFGVILHLMLHWSWICGVLGSRFLRARSGRKWAMDDGQRTILGVGLMIVLLNIMGLGIAVAALSLQPPL